MSHADESPELKKQFYQLLWMVLQLPLEDLIQEIHPLNSFTLDSIHFLEVVLKSQEVFEIKMRPQDLAKIKTLDDLWSTICHLKSLS